ncbi:MAG: dimethyl sulfoxide reductase anchor subunit, partial [Burkholderiales bacterium]|nr:dimethyl sulfoxide reductase anchor subunit [Burkholderiales bacterium]
MNPAWSVVFLTTLAGAGQGLVLALFEAEWAHRAGYLAVGPEPRLVAFGALGGALLACGGLLASFLHLGRPERAWRAAAMWRTSWLSREVLVLPAFIALAAAYGAAPFWAPGFGFALGALATVAALALFLCTGMIYACIRFLQAWATPLTPLNFTLLGCANGFTIAVALAAALGRA